MEEQKGLFGEFGGSFVPEQLEAVLENIGREFESAIKDDDFNKDLNYYLKHYVGRPSPLYLAENITRKLGGAKIYLKREDLNHTGAHKINNTIGQALLARRMGHKRIIAETGAGQHGVATATAAALFGMDCVIYMGEKDVLKQPLNVYRMELLGAKVITVTNGARDLKAAVDEALMDLVQNSESTFYVLGSAVGPYPYPQIVKHFQSIISEEIAVQILEQENRYPDYVIACVGGGSNAIGAFAKFIGNKEVKLIGVEPGGIGMETGLHAAPLTEGKIGVIHGFKTYVMLDDENEILTSHSIASGLNYPGVGPEHSYMKDAGLAEYFAVTDFEALHAFRKLSKHEGIIPAIESAHALAYAMKLAPTLSKEKLIVVNLSGRGDKDLDTILNSEKVSMEMLDNLNKAGQ
ncbi:MAG: tryptophan synthase subunit beta [Fusobacteria bacterium]|nr:tryptophan synthase subunit beta [Fusobacteriota bacterium]